MNCKIGSLLVMAMLLTPATTTFCQAVEQNANPPMTVKSCVSRMSELCGKISLDWNTVFDAVGDSIKTHYTERFIALELAGQDGLTLRYKLLGTRDASSLSGGKDFAWNDRGITVYEVSLKSLNENKITPSKKVSSRSNDSAESARYTYVFVLTDDMTAKVKVSYEDARDSWRINGIAQTDEDTGTYSRPPRDRPSLVLNLTTIEDAQEVASLLKTAIELAKKE